jgi:hypothetical protein
MNCRLHFDYDDFYVYAGRTDKANFTPAQHDFLNELCGPSALRAMDILKEFNIGSLTVYGEFFGPGIQGGGKYSNQLRFNAFDMLVDDEVWLDVNSVRGN